MCRYHVKCYNFFTMLDADAPVFDHRQATKLSWWSRHIVPKAPFAVNQPKICFIHLKTYLVHVGTVLRDKSAHR